LRRSLRSASARLGASASQLAAAVRRASMSARRSASLRPAALRRQAASTAARRLGVDGVACSVPVGAWPAAGHGASSASTARVKTAIEGWGLRIGSSEMSVRNPAMGPARRRAACGRPARGLASRGAVAPPHHRIMT